MEFNRASTSMICAALVLGLVDFAGDMVGDESFGSRRQRRRECATTSPRMGVDETLNRDVDAAA